MTLNEATTMNNNKCPCEPIADALVGGLGNQMSTSSTGTLLIQHGLVALIGRQPKFFFPTQCA